MSLFLTDVISRIKVHVAVPIDRSSPLHKARNSELTDMLTDLFKNVGPHDHAAATVADYSFVTVEKHPFDENSRNNVNNDAVVLSVDARTIPDQNLARDDIETAGKKLSALFRNAAVKVFSGKDIFVFHANPHRPEMNETTASLPEIKK